MKLEERVSLLTPFNTLPKYKKANNNQPIPRSPSPAHTKQKVPKEIILKEPEGDPMITEPTINIAKKGETIPDSHVAILEGHTGEVFGCSWNPKFPLLASGSSDGTARIWKIPNNDTPLTAKQVEEITKSCIVLKHNTTAVTDKSRDVTTLDWSSDGNLLASGSYDGIARIWDCKGKSILKLTKHAGAIFSVKWSSNGEYLLSGSIDRTTIVWETSTGYVKQQFEFHTAPTLDIDWRDSNSFASCGSDSLIYVCEIGNPKPIKTFKGHTDEVNGIRWSPDSSLLASCSDDYTAKIWKLDSDKYLDLTDHTKEIYTIKWSPSGPGSANPNAPLVLATASFDATVKLWDVEVGKCIHNLKKHADPIYSVAFSPDGNFLASGSFDRHLHIWSVRDGKHLKSYKGNGGIFEVSWNPKGDKVAASFANETICVVDLRM